MVYKFFEEQKIEKWEGVLLGSVAISSLLNWGCEIILSKKWNNLADIYKQIILVIVSVILAGIIVRIRDSVSYTKILHFFGRTDGRSIWRALFEAKKGTDKTWVRIRRELHGEPVEIVGYVEYYESPNANTERGHLVLRDYKLTWTKTGKQYQSDTNNLMYLDSNEILLLEVIGQSEEHSSPKKSWWKKLFARKKRK